MQDQLIRVVTDFFESEKWRINPIEGDTAFSTRHTGKATSWVCVGKTDEADRSFVFYSVSPIKAPKESYPAIAELLSRINYSLHSGNFELGYFDGDIRFRTSVEVGADSLGHAMIDRVVYNNVVAMDLYLPAILAVVAEDAKPLDAIAKALGV
jgi:hypothetical protein